MNKHDDHNDPMDDLAPGHNPDKLTRRQVETDLGWRLLERGELGDHHLSNPDIYLWCIDEKWSDGGNDGNVCDCTYRTKRPVGYFLPLVEQQDAAPNPQNRQFKTGAQRDGDQGKGLPHLIPTRPLDLLARHFQTGAEKYGRNNWQKGIPVSAYYDSAMRHLWAVHRGETNEPHLTACIWNLVCLQDTLQSIAAGDLPDDLNDLSFHTEEL